MSKDKRSIKVYRAYAHGDQEVPEIRLKGNWLYECGFSAGQEITVQCMEGKLIITAENLPNQE